MTFWLFLARNILLVATQKFSTLITLYHENAKQEACEHIKSHSGSLPGYSKLHYKLQDHIFHQAWPVMHGSAKDRYFHMKPS